MFVVDVEATCWATKEEQGNRPNEVIEIGICELHRDHGIQNISSYVVFPKYTTVSQFCTELTGWTQEQVSEGNSMEDTLIQIQDDYGLTKDHVWFSYGEYDRVKLSSTPGQQGGLFELYGIQRDRNPFAQMRAHMNAKTLFALKAGLQKEIGMAQALKHIGEKLEGRHHNGADDAANIAKILRWTLS